MTQVTYRKIQLPAERELLIEWLTSGEWPFHGNSKLTREKVESLLAEGFFDGTDHQTYWIVQGEERVGYIRLFDLDDIGSGAPLFDLRIKTDKRRRGLGKAAVSWLTNYLFETWPVLHRIEGTTRADNLGMRRVFKACGFAREGHYRKAWKDSHGVFHDTAHYAILREDWVSGQCTPVDFSDDV